MTALNNANTSARIVPILAPLHWRAPCANVECSLHQLAPYIGKIKSSIAGELIERYSKRGELVVDPFAGAGTIPLEAALRERRAFGADISPYSRILSKAKLLPPQSLEAATRSAKRLLNAAEKVPKPDLRCVPQWVRKFFHPETLREALRFAAVARQEGNEFLMACFLGILHHQRPGFLSFPSSHLVPYLRNKKFPPAKFPEMYQYRELRPRLLAKIERSYKRFQLPLDKRVRFAEVAVQSLELPSRFDALITSPPYMNALDYGRDNRLRLWFIDPALTVPVDNDVTQRLKAFVEATTSLGKKIEKGLKEKGYCVFVVGVASTRKFDAHPSQVVLDVLKKEAPSLHLQNVIVDDIPDIRRTRRECRGVKAEHILVFQRH
ncbi:MAG: DNA adenine methylase [Chthoniobacter sp.]|nr:DNA adenine methylase [Chthoniobacter sp.]